MGFRGLWCERYGMVEFQAVKVSRVSDSIVKQIEDMILEGLLKPGERLPPERELAEQLSVSRPSLREATVILESKGLVTVKRGGGTFVRDVAGATITEPLSSLLQSHPETTFDVLELRHALEEAAAYLAAQRATESDREALKRRYEALEAIYDSAAADRAEEAVADVEFHLAIAEASHNLAFVHVMRGLMAVMRDSILFNLTKIRESRENHAAIREQHKALFDAVMAGDEAAARQAARQHLAFVQETLREGAQSEAREARAKRRMR